MTDEKGLTPYQAQSFVELAHRAGAEVRKSEGAAYMKFVKDMTEEFHKQPAEVRAIFREEYAPDMGKKVKKDLEKISEAVLDSYLRYVKQTYP